MQQSLFQFNSSNRQAYTTENKAYSSSTVPTVRRILRRTKPIPVQQFQPSGVYYGEQSLFQFNSSNRQAYTTENKAYSSSTVPTVRRILRRTKPIPVQQFQPSGVYYGEQSLFQFNSSNRQAYTTENKAYSSSTVPTVRCILRRRSTLLNTISSIG